MSAEEKALTANPSKAEHGVILLLETERNDDFRARTQVRFHMRAKILSNEARGLANVEIPVGFGDSDSVEIWWGRTILPDGAVVEVAREELKEQVVESMAGKEKRVLKVAMPSVVPGCVIDYGYELHQRGGQVSRLIPLQTSWPVREFRYRWLPNRESSSAYRVARAGGLDVRVLDGKKTILVIARNLPAVEDEPWSPPGEELRATVRMSYIPAMKDLEDFWNSEAKYIHMNLMRLTTPEGTVRKTLQGILGDPPSGELSAKLQRIYEWLLANVKNTTMRSAEQIELDAASKEKPVNENSWRMSSILRSHEATAAELDNLFISLARAAGAEVNKVFAVDRRERYWDQQYLFMGQFDYTFVAVRAPGEPIEKSVFVDTSSGLPYGEIPWWFTPTLAMIAAEDGGHVVTLKASDPRRNLMTTRVAIGFTEGNESMKVEWSRSGRGQQGLASRYSLRRLGPTDRTKKLEELCGASGRFEVTKSEAGDLDNLSTPFQLHCEGLQLETGFDETSEEYVFRMPGRVIPELPELTALTRTNPVILSYPMVDSTTVDVSSPAGYVSGAPPPPVKIESPFGRYQLTVKSAPVGFHVERLFALLAVNVPVKDYEGLRSFLSDVLKADKSPMPFRRAGSDQRQGE